MFARFFIDRPIFAAVLSIVIVLAGGLAVWQLPLAQYPPIAPPTVQVECRYPGASAQVVAETIAAPIEQQVNGVEDMLYMSSQSTSDGSYTLTVTFRLGVDLNLAQVLVQNRVALALPLLPDVVKATGVVTKKRSPDILLVASVISPDGRFDQLYLSNYALMHVRDELSRLPGISEVLLFGQRDYSMRLWVDPERMSVRGITAGDVVRALQEQNVQVSAGQVGASPTDGGAVSTQMVLTTLGRLSEVGQYEDVVVKKGAEGRLVRVKDIARVEMSARSVDINNRFGVKPKPGEQARANAGVGLAIFQLPDANALETADRVKEKLAQLKDDFPDGLTYMIGYDTTPFIRESINEVFKALRDAVLLVAVVVLVFLQNWRSALIPLVAVPVAVVGTFAVMLAAGFSLNNLTLFGLVLAIGIVVDDAIVVVEAVEHHIELGLSPREATIKAMDEVSGPVIAVGLVLSSVFIPCAFIGGIIGQFFRQFALTIAISTLISAFNSLTLSPALAAILLKPKDAPKDWFQQLIDLTLGWFFWLFNWGFKFGTGGYARVVGLAIRLSVLVLVIYGGLLGLTWWGFQQLPTGFIPAQDKGYLLASIQLPDAASAERTQAAIRKIETVALTTPGIKYTTSIAGNSFLLSAYGSNFGSMFIILDDFDYRAERHLPSGKVLADLQKRLNEEVPEATVALFGPPPVNGLGRAGGYRVMIEDRAEVGLTALQKETENMVDKIRAEPKLGSGFTVFTANSPQLFVDLNRQECLKQGVELGEVFSALQVFLGSRYVNDYNRFGRTWQVNVQADARFRNGVDDVKRLKVRNKAGQMVPISTLASVRDQPGPLVITRYNMYPAAGINGAAGPGVSSGEAIAAIEAIAGQELPPGMTAEFTEIFFLEKISGGTGMTVFVFSVLFVFLVLAFLYESWSLPLAVILVVPMCVLSSIAGVALAGHDINIFTQVGFVVLIGLACKNAILIVEFAKLKRDEGAAATDAALDASRLRLRPILMTSAAFILGVVPLLFAHGAGAEMRQVLGVAVFAGMLGVTAFGIFLTPVFYVVVDWWASWWVFAVPAVQRVNDVSMDILTAK
ncbi:MAG: efflux RND transporter permease subunit, partial [Gemmataceae bacterium]